MFGRSLFHFEVDSKSLTTMMLWVQDVLLTNVFTAVPFLLIVIFLAFKAEGHEALGVQILADTKRVITFFTVVCMLEYHFILL